MLGFYVTGHPLDHYDDKVRELASHDTSTLEGLEKGVEVALCGVLTGIQRKRNREQKPWAAMQIEDRVGSIEAMVFAAGFERLAPLIVEDQAVLVRGLVLPEENAAPKISIQEIIPLEVARVALPSLISIRVWLDRNGVADKPAALCDLFTNKPGESQVRLRLEMPRDFSVILDVPAKVRPDKRISRGAREDLRAGLCRSSGELIRHSARSASEGERALARSAGISAATNAEPPKAKAAPVITKGSY